MPEHDKYRDVDPSTSKAVDKSRKTHDDKPNAEYLNVENTQLVLTELLKSLAMNNVKFPEYKKGENFTRFSERFEEAFRIYGVSDKEIKPLVLQYVDDVTYEVLKNVYIPQNIETNIGRVLEIFNTAMSNPLSSTALTKSQLYDIRQNQGETVEDFVSRIREAVSVSGLQTDKDEVMAMMLMRGLTNTRIKKKVATNLDKSFEEIVLMMREIVTVDRLVFGDDVAVAAPVLVVENGGKKKRQNERSGYRSEESSRSSSKEHCSCCSRRNRERCYICGEESHFARNCRSKERY